MISAERVRQLAREGWIEKQGKDQFYLVDVVQGYIRFRNDADRRAQKSAADSRVRDARAREIELRNAVREGRLIEIDEAVSTVTGPIWRMMPAWPSPSRGAVIHPRPYDRGGAYNAA